MLFNCVYPAACNWNSNCWERCCYMQVSIWSHHCVGLSVRCISYCLHCGWVLVFILPLQREVYSTGCFIPVHWLPCILQYCFVSSLFFCPFVKINSFLLSSGFVCTILCQFSRKVDNFICYDTVYLGAIQEKLGP